MYYNETKINASYEDALQRVKLALSKEGFGILTEINVQATLKAKLNIDFDKYTILGACNPPLAYKALQAERQIGLLLPCNLIVYEKDNEVKVASILPTVAMEKTGNAELLSVAKEVEGKLKKVINSLL